MSWLDNLFSNLNRRTDYVSYYEWAYPYGEPQKQKIEELAHAFISDEDPKMVVYNYLVAKQILAPESDEKKHILTDDDFIDSFKKMKKQLLSKGKKQMHMYMALVEADLKVDESLNYPSIQELEERSNNIKAIIHK